MLTLTVSQCALFWVKLPFNTEAAEELVLLKRQMGRGFGYGRLVSG